MLKVLGATQSLELEEFILKTVLEVEDDHARSDLLLALRAAQPAGNRVAVDCELLHLAKRMLDKSKELLLVIVENSADIKRELLAPIFEVIAGLPEHARRITVLALARSIPADLFDAERFIALIEGLSDCETRVATYQEMAKHRVSVRTMLFERALQAAVDISALDRHAELLKILALDAAELKCGDVAGDALARVADLDYAERTPVNTLVECMRRCDLPQKKLIALVRRSKSAVNRSELMNATALKLSNESLVEVLVIAQSIGDEKWRARLRARLWSHDQNMGLQKFVDELLNTFDQSDAFGTIATLAPKMPLDVASGALARIAKHTDETVENRLVAKEALLFRLCQLGQVDQARDHVYAESDAEARDFLVAALAPYTDNLGLWKSVFRGIRRLPDPRQKMRRVTALAPHAPESIQSELFLAAHRILDPQHRFQTVRDTAPYANQEVTQEAMARSEKISDHIERTKVRCALSMRFSDDKSRSLTSEAMRIGLPAERAQAIACLLPMLSEPQRHQAVNEAVASLRPVDEAPAFANALSQIAPYIDRPEMLELADQGLRMAEDLEAGHLRREALQAIAIALCQISPEDIKPLLGRSLDILARRHRSDFLWDLEALAPVFEKCGSDLCKRIQDAVIDVGRWWP